MGEQLDPAAIMAEHRLSVIRRYSARYPENDTSYLVEMLDRLAADVVRLRAQNKASSDEWTRRTAQMQSELDRRRQDARRGARLLSEAIGRGDGIGFSNNDLQQMVAYLDRLAEVRGQPWPEWVSLDQFRAALATKGDQRA